MLRPGASQTYTYLSGPPALQNIAPENIRNELLRALFSARNNSIADISADRFLTMASKNETKVSDPRHLAPRDVIQLHVTSPPWETGEAGSSEPTSRTEQMRSWTVAETGRFLQEQDLAGPAELARMSGVNDVDLLEASVEQLSTEIRLTPSAARKVAAARDAFLSE